MPTYFNNYIPQPYFNYPSNPFQFYSQSNYCTSGNTNSYDCNGNMRQVLYQYSDCSTVWKNMENCQYGCSNGFCNGAPAVTVSTVTVIQKPSYDFSGLGVFVLIVGVIVLFVIFIKFFNESSERRNGYRGSPEYWRSF